MSGAMDAGGTSTGQDLQHGEGAAEGTQQGSDGQQDYTARWNYRNPYGSWDWWQVNGRRAYGGSWDNTWQPQWHTSPWQGQGWQQAYASSDSEGRTAAGPQQAGNSRSGEASTSTGQEHSDSNRRQSMSTMDEETWAGDATGSLDEGSRDEPASSRGASAKSGKDFIPEYDGTAPMRGIPEASQSV